MSPDEQALRTVRVLHLTMILSVSALIAMGEWIRGQNAESGIENLDVIHKAFLVVLVSLLGAIALVGSLRTVLWRELVAARLFPSPQPR